MLLNLPNPSTRTPSRHLTLEPTPAAGRSSIPAEPRMKTEVTYPGRSVRAPPARLRPCADGADRAPRCRDGGARARALRQAGRRWGIGLRRKNETRLFLLLLFGKKTTRGDLRKQRLRSRIICRPTLGRIPLWAYLFWHGFSRLYSSIAFAIAAPAATVSSPFLVGIRESPWRTTHLVPPRRYKGRGMQGKAAAEGSSV